MQGVKEGHQVWTPQLRAKLLEVIASGQAFNLNAAAKLLSVGRATIFAHMDDTLRAEIEEAKQSYLDHLEDVMAHAGKDHSKGFLSRMATLKAYRRERWGDIPTTHNLPHINITIVTPSPQELSNLIEGDFRVLSPPLPSAEEPPKEENL